MCNDSVHNSTSNHFNSNIYPQPAQSKGKEKRAKGQEDQVNFV